MEYKVFAGCIFCCDDSEWAVFIDFHGASSFVLCLMYIFFSLGRSGDEWCEW